VIKLNSSEIPVITDMADAQSVRALPPIYEGKPSCSAELAERINNPLVQRQARYKDMAEAYIRREAEKFTHEMVTNIQNGANRESELIRLSEWTQKYQPKGDPMDDAMAIRMG
jgi:hypothetical protein